MRDRLAGHNASVTALAIHPQGDHVITGSDDTTLQRWLRDSAIQAKDTKKNAVRNSPAQSTAGADMHVPLKSRPENLPRLKLVGSDAERRVRFESAGMHLTLPAGLKRSEGHVYLSTGMALKGDFTVTVNYEILKLPEPKDAGPESGVTLLLWRGKADSCMTGMTRRVVEKGVPQFSAWCTWFARPGEATDHKEILAPTQAKSGRLRLQRRGGELSYYASESSDAELKLLNQLFIGEADLDDLRLLGFVGGPSASLDARFWDLRIRSRNIPGDPTAPAAAEAKATPTTSHMLSWLTVASVCLIFALLVAGLLLLLWLRRLRSVHTRMSADEPSPAVSYISFTCSCGKALKTKTKQAGKKVKCPNCGVSVLVPRHEST
jgi:DNA-directed RNA polymerase subunit RPC12/RpoP